MPTFGSLFSGIGGMDLGLERAGWECRWQVEIDEYCQRVLAKHWPGVPKYRDVREAGEELERVDLIAGGFPCQPVSVAGKRLAQEDERWLWPEFARILRLLRPRHALMENVPGLLIRGFGDVLGDLAALGYHAEWQCLPAAAFGAPHLRWRVFVVGYSHGDNRRASGAGQSQAQATGQPLSSGEPDAATLAHAQEQRGELWAAAGSRSERPTSSRGGGGPNPDSTGLEGPRLRGPVAECDWWAVEPDVGRVAHGVPARVDQLRGLGNAVVPQVAEYIGRLLLEGEGVTAEQS